MSRKWIQGHPTLSFGKHREASWVHFDIAASKKARARLNGAVLTDRFGPLEHLVKIDIGSGDADRVARGEAKLRQIAASRAL